MKQLNTIFIAIFLALTAYTVQAQKDCEVKVLGIEKTYEGDCKKGLAHGEGKASGDDTYQGTFKKGLPNGYGEYVWTNGNIYKGEWKRGMKDGKGELKLIREGIDSVVVGYWSNDKYIGEYEYPYEVLSKTPDIVSVSFSQKGDEKNELILFITKGQTPTPVIGLSVTGLYGAGTPVNRTVVYRYIDYPWQGSIRFSYQDKGLKAEELIVKINAPGVWEIRIDLRFTR
jgi:hypothetical protein